MNWQPIVKGAQKVLGTLTDLKEVMNLPAWAKGFLQGGRNLGLWALGKGPGPTSLNLPHKPGTK